VIESPSVRSPEKALRWDLVFLELAVAELFFVDASGVLEIYDNI
jgi:hypothetical protein